MHFLTNIIIINLNVNKTKKIICYKKEINMDIEEIKRILKAFRICTPLFLAFGDKYRQKIIFDIIEAGSEGINVTNLSAKQELSRPAISHHLRILKENGIIVPHKVGTQIFYKVNLTQKFTVLKEVINSTLAVLSKIEESCEFDGSLLEEKKDLQI